MKVIKTVVVFGVLNVVFWTAIFIAVAFREKK